MLAAKQRLSLLVILFFLITSYTYAGTIVVNSTADTDARGDDITLREAIMLSEGTLNFDLLTPEEQTQVSTPVGRGIADTINFGIPGTIAPNSSLPTITDNETVIDASSQWVGVWPGGEPGVVLDGDWNDTGLHIGGAADCHIRGLLITEFVSGISIDDGAKSNTIGGSDTGNRNVISGNADGMIIHGSGTDRNVVSGNYIGTDVTGTAAVGNENLGINIGHAAQWNTIGGTTAGERNIISGNVGWCGVVIAGTGTDNNAVKGNYIGTDVSGTAALGNSDHGATIVSGAQYNTIGGTTPEERNIISGNIGNGVTINDAANNKVSGNYIGTDVTGKARLGNEGNGVDLYLGPQSNTIGGTTPGERNIISGNAIGVNIGNPETGNNEVIGNSIGTDATGTMDLGNRWYGIHIEDGTQSNTIGRVDAGNTIAFNGSEGVFIEGGESVFNTISGNSMYNNFELGIELKWGGNDEIEPPNILWSGLTDDTLTISGDGAGADATVEVFIADSSDEEGQVYLGSLIANGSGMFFDSMSVTGKDLSIGDRIVATTTHTDDNTSEFSLPSRISVPPYDVAIFYDEDQAVGDPVDAELYAHLLVEELENKGLSSGIVDSEELAEYMRANPKGIMLICQCLVPGTIFQDKGEEDLIYSWLRNGGIGGFALELPFYYWDFYFNVSAEGPKGIFGVDVVRETTVNVKPTELGLKYIPSMLDEWPTNLSAYLPILENYPLQYESYADDGAYSDLIAYRTEDMEGWFIHFSIGYLDYRRPYEQMAREYAELISNRFAGELAISMDQPPNGIIVTEGEAVNISWTGSGRTASSVSLAIDDDSVWGNGSAEEWLAPDQPVGGNYSWDTSNVPAGDYYVVAVVTDGDNEAYSIARVGVDVRVLTIDSVDAAPGIPATVQVSVSDASGIASGDMVIEYDAGMITVDDVTATDLLSGIIVIPNIDTAGEIRLSMAGATGLPEGSGALVEIAFTVNADAQLDTETTFVFSDASVYDELGAMIPVRLENGVVSITQMGIKGDVNNDGAVRSNDATLALRIAAQLMIPTEYEHWAADMNDDGVVRANDATLILRTATGLAAPGIGVISDAGGRIAVMLSEAHGIIGERITVPITVDNVGMLASGEICIAYDSTVLRAVDVLSESGALLVSNATEPGILRIAFASANKLNSQTIAEIQFDVLADSASLLKFRRVEFYGPDALLVNSRGIDKEFRPWAIIPKHNSLLQNFPNPFNPETWIPYQLAEDSEVTVRVYNTTGQLIRTIDLGYREAGSYVTRDAAAYWDGKSEAGERVASGVYFYSIQAGGYGATRKMTVAQ
ncbi:cohesin domain-containing protein [Candidatus Poribacteria bacterium]